MESTTNKQTGDHSVEQPHRHGHNDRYNHDQEAGRAEEDHRSTTLSVTDGGGRSDTSSQHSSEHDSPPVTRVPTHVSLGPDNPVEHYTSYVEVPDSAYGGTSPRRKLVVVALLSYCSFLAPVSSTTVLSAAPEVAAEYGTTGPVVGLANALYMLFMGVSPIVWGPFSEVWGRRSVSWVGAFLVPPAWGGGAWGERTCLGRADMPVVCVL